MRPLINKSKSIQLPVSLTTILLIAAFIASSMASASSVVEQTRIYAVEYQGKDAGELEVIIRREGEGYLVRSISHLSALAQLFLKSHTIESRFELKNDQLRLVSGREILNESGKVKREFSIDHDNNTVTFSAGEPIKFPQGFRIDADSFPLGLMTSNPTTLTGESYLSISPKRARQYIYQSPVEEIVSVPAGDFTTTRVVGIRNDNPNRSVSFWLDKGNQQLPVKITNSKDGRETILVLVK